MATTTQVLDAIAAATGARFEDLRFRGRVLREGGLLPQGGRGFGAAHLGVEALINVLLGVLLVERGITTTMLERLRRAQRLQYRGLTIEAPSGSRQRRLRISPGSKSTESEDVLPTIPGFDTRVLHGLTFAGALRSLVESATTERGRAALRHWIHGVMVRSDGRLGSIQVARDGMIEAHWYEPPPSTVSEPMPVLETNRPAPMKITASFPVEILVVLADLLIDTRRHVAAQSETGTAGPTAMPANDAAPHGGSGQKQGPSPSRSRLTSAKRVISLATALKGKGG
jgi:hypothetical protein